MDRMQGGSLPTPSGGRIYIISFVLSLVIHHTEV